MMQSFPRMRLACAGQAASLSPAQEGFDAFASAACDDIPSEPSSLDGETTLPRRLLSAFLAAIIAAAVFAACCTQAFETEHDCIGDGCPICAVLACSHVVLGMASASVPSFASAFALAFCVALVCIAPALARRAQSLVSLHVRLDI